MSQMCVNACATCSYDMKSYMHTPPQLWMKIGLLWREIITGILQHAKPEHGWCWCGGFQDSLRGLTYVYNGTFVVRQMLEWVCLKLSTEELWCTCTVVGLTPRLATPFTLHAWMDSAFIRTMRKFRKCKNQKSCGLLGLHGGSVLLTFT